MSVSAVVCEFNPFHNGHKYLLEQMKKDSEYVICIMSGNFVQRGEFAVYDKYLRAEAAVKSGADIVIELPIPYALGSAETFARGSIGILDGLGFVDKLFFGSESSLDSLKSTLEITKTDNFAQKLNSLMKNGLSYPDAFFEAAGTDCLCGGNDILALEYLRQLEAFESRIVPVAVERIGNEHNSDKVCGEYASASHIRKLLYASKPIIGYVPYDIPENEISHSEKLELSALSVLRKMSETDFSNIADVNEGLEFRLKKAVLDAESLDDLFEKVRTKRYTLSKIRRVLLCSYLGVTKEMQKEIPGFVNVLALGNNGADVLSMMKKSSSILPVIRYSDTEKLSQSDKRLYDFTAECDDIFGLTLDKVRMAGYDMRRRFEITE